MSGSVKKKTPLSGYEREMRILKLEETIIELTDSIACAEHDIEQDGRTNYNIDDARCRLHDAKENLKEIRNEHPT